MDRRHAQVGMLLTATLLISGCRESGETAPPQGDSGSGSSAVQEQTSSVASEGRDVTVNEPAPAAPPPDRGPDGGSPGEKVLPGDESSTSTAPPPKAAPQTLPGFPVPDAASQRLRSLTLRMVADAKTKNEEVLFELSRQLAVRLRSMDLAIPEQLDRRSQLQSILVQLNADRNAEALRILAEISEEEFTPAQKEAASALRRAVGALVLWREFGASPGVEAEVSSIVAALTTGETENTVADIQALVQKPGGNGAQQALLQQVADACVP